MRVRDVGVRMLDLGIDHYFTSRKWTAVDSQGELKDPLFMVTCRVNGTDFQGNGALLDEAVNRMLTAVARHVRGAK